MAVTWDLQEGPQLSLVLNKPGEPQLNWEVSRLAVPQLSLGNNRQENSQSNLEANKQEDLRRSLATDDPCFNVENRDAQWDSIRGLPTTDTVRSLITTKVTGVDHAP